VLHWLARRAARRPELSAKVFRLMDAVCADRELGAAALGTVNFVGESPLHVALPSGDPKLLALLLRRGANPTLPCHVRWAGVGCN
jgi:hypothetical protein